MRVEVEMFEKVFGQSEFGKFLSGVVGMKSSLVIDQATRCAKSWA
jgi:hypothetical protein